MNEISFYPGICDYFERQLKLALPNVKIASAIDGTLNNLICQTSTKLQLSSTFSNQYIPKLKVDILFHFAQDGEETLLLFEVKYSESLKLMNYSQLLGYLHVAKIIETGILLLVPKPDTRSILSNDFDEILQMNSLPLKVKLTDDRVGGVDMSRISTGITEFSVGGTPAWYGSGAPEGIGSMEALADQVRNCLNPPLTLSKVAEHKGPPYGK